MCAHQGALPGPVAPETRRKERRKERKKLTAVVLYSLSCRHHWAAARGHGWAHVLSMPALEKEEEGNLLASKEKEEVEVKKRERAEKEDMQ